MPPMTQQSTDEDLFDEPLKPKLSVDDIEFIDEDNEPAFVKNPEDLDNKIKRRSQQLSVSMMQNEEVSKVVKEIAASSPQLVAVKSDPE